MLPLGRSLVRLFRCVSRHAALPQPLGASGAGASGSGTGVGAGAAAAGAAAAGATADEALTEALVQHGWLLDVATDPAFREVAKPLTALLQLTRTPSLLSVQRWLQSVWKAPPPAVPHSSESLRLRAALSLGMRYCVAKYRPAGSSAAAPAAIDLALAAASAAPVNAASDVSTSLAPTNLTPDSAPNTALVMAEALSRPNAHRDALAALPGLHLWLSAQPHSYGVPSWVSFPPNASEGRATSGGGEEAERRPERHPLLRDDEVKAPFVEGLPFGWLLCLTHASEGVPPEMARWGAMLPHIDSALIALLRLPTLSSEAFQLRSVLIGTPRHLEEAACARLRLVCTMLAQHAADHAATPCTPATPAAIALPTILRYDAIERTFSGPSLGGQPAPTRTRQLFALVEAAGPLGAVMGAEGGGRVGGGAGGGGGGGGGDGGGGGGGGSSVRVCIAGDVEDLAADLADEVATKLLPRGCPRPSRLLGLLPYLEDERRFHKLLRRDFPLAAAKLLTTAPPPPPPPGPPPPPPPPPPTGSRAGASRASAFESAGVPCLACGHCNGRWRRSRRAQAHRFRSCARVRGAQGTGQ